MLQSWGRGECSEKKLNKHTHTHTHVMYIYVNMSLIDSVHTFPILLHSLFILELLVVGANKTKILE